MANPKEKEQAVDKDFTGTAAQDDPNTANESNEFSIDAGDNAEDEFNIEDSLEGLENEDLTDFDSDLAKLAYPNMVILPKRPLLQFLRMVESWTKVSIDSYGKALRIRSLDNDIVELTYSNKPTFITVKVPNSSGKQISPYFVRIEVLKKVVAQSSNTVALVDADESLSIPLANQLIMIDTIKLHDNVYDTPTYEADKDYGDIDVVKFSEIIKAFNITSSFSERAQDKVIKFFSSGKAVVASPAINLNSSTPFNLCKTDFEISKSFIESLHILVNNSVGVTYTLKSNGEKIYLELTVGAHVFISSQVMPTEPLPILNEAHSAEFNTDWDAIKQLSRITSTFDYYNPVLAFAINGDVLEVETRTKDLIKVSHLTFPIQKSLPRTSELKFNSKILAQILAQDLIIEKATFSDKSLTLTTNNSAITISANF